MALAETTGPADLHAGPEFAWCPRWDGETVVIVASGPSASTVPVYLAEGRARCIAINTSYKLAPWADVLYGCDYAWWLKQRGMPDWPGLRVSQDRVACEMYPGIHRVYCNRKAETLQFERLGHILWAGNSGLQAVNLAAQWGAVKIILVGFDMTVSHGSHWHGPHGAGLSNPSVNSVRRWQHRTDQAAAALAARGIRAINCSPISVLTRYPRMTLAEALEC